MLSRRSSSWIVKTFLLQPFIYLSQNTVYTLTIVPMIVYRIFADSKRIKNLVWTLYILLLFTAEYCITLVSGELCYLWGDASCEVEYEFRRLISSRDPNHSGNTFIRIREISYFPHQARVYRLLANCGDWLLHPSNPHLSPLLTNLIKLLICL